MKNNTKITIFGLFIMLFLTSSTIATVINTNEYWIGPFHNGNIIGSRANIGRMATQLDGSSQTNFDYNMNNLPPNAIIHILNGTYTTLGCLSWGPKTGQKIMGSGITATILQFPKKLSPNLKWVIEPLYPYNQTNILVSDLTIDCNYQPGVLTTLDGISLHGGNNTIERVRLINAASFTLNDSIYSEDFGLVISGFPYEYATNNLIENCIVSNYTCNYYNNMSAIAITGTDGGEILNNTIIEDSDNFILALGCIGSNFIVSSNNTLGCIIGYHSDSTGGVTNITIINNNFLNCASAFFSANSINFNLNISSNNISLKDFYEEYTTDGIFLYPSPTSGFTNILISYNNVSVNTTNNDNTIPDANFVIVYNANNIKVLNNKIDKSLKNSFFSSDNIVIK